jgi:peptide/nickel transport system substrate-binding protein
MAIDREGIAAAVMGGLGTPAAQLVPPGVLGHNEELRPPEFDPAAARALVAEAAADGVPTDRTITILARNGQFPGTAETAEVLQYALEQIGLDAAVRMVETATHVEYQVRPHPADAGPIALIFMHGNQAGDAGFTTSQYLLSEGPQSTFGDAELDGRIADANRLAGDEREQAFAELLAYQDEELTQYAPLAHMRGLIGVAPTVDYEPTPSSQDNLRLAEVTPRKAADH